MSAPLLPAVTDLLCVASAGTCAALLLRTWITTRSRLILWTGCSFVLLTINNLLLVLDLLVLPTVDLWPFRAATFVAALLVLIGGFIWEAG